MTVRVGDYSLDFGKWFVDVWMVIRKDEYGELNVFVFRLGGGKSGR